MEGNKVCREGGDGQRAARGMRSGGLAAAAQCRLRHLAAPPAPPGPKFNPVARLATLLRLESCFVIS